jgi:endonuclease/exonuclease/phosphatase (EEP) superfamily protein YafD
VVALIGAERIPTVVAGDLNTPDHGVIYHLFTSVAVDAFAKAGSGWGLTFPGSTRNPVAFFGPWLRLDYLFSREGMETLSCYPEAGRLSQHCAVVGRFRLGAAP